MKLETVTITLDGAEVSGHPGMTVLELARESGVSIPTLCYHRHLSPVGACRVCLVEEERSGALLASCVAPITPGMVVNTRSPRVLERRRMVLKLMLASHPDSCMVCDKGNCCELRRLAAEMGVGWVDLDRIPQRAAVEEVNPFIERDLSRCILCGRCIRADQELVVEGAIDYFDRGFCSKPATFGDQPLERSECTFCGTCVALCPTGALMEKVKPYRGAVAQSVSAVCPFCGCGCAIRLDVKDGVVVRARPDEKQSANGSTLCARGAYGYDFLNSPERLTSPLVKVNGRFEAVSWDQALNLVASELQRIRSTYGAQSVAVLGSSKCTNEENYLLQKVTRAALGTNNVDNGNRLYGGPSFTTSGPLARRRGAEGSIEDIEKSDVILVVGADPTVSAPLVGYAIKRAAKLGGAKLALVDPRCTKLALLAHLWLRPRPGTDVALINGLAHVIIKEGLGKREPVSAATPGFEAFAKCVRRYTPSHVAALTGVRPKDVLATARVLAAAGRASFICGNGILQQPDGVDGVRALSNLALLVGGAVHVLQRENNARGACDMGAVPDSLPGYHRVDDAAARRRFEERWGVGLPATPGLTAVEMVQQARAGGIKAMYIVGENPALSFPQPSLVKEALASLEFLAVQDLFLTETAGLAKVVFPAASFAEKEGTFTNFEGVVQRLHRAIDPRGDCLPDWKVLVQLGSRMGCRMPYSSPEEVMREVADLVPLYQGVEYGRLERGGIPVPAPDLTREISDSSDRAAEGAPRRFFPVECVESDEAAKDGYPLTLLTGTTLYGFGSGTRSSRSPRLKAMAGSPTVEMSRPDAEVLHVAEGEAVRVISACGEVRAAARLTDSLPAGVLFMPIGLPQSPVHELFGIFLNAMTKSPSLKRCAVRLERVS